jgi:hypothetical protein
MANPDAESDSVCGMRDGTLGFIKVDGTVYVRTVGHRNFVR